MVVSIVQGALCDHDGLSRILLKWTILNIRLCQDRSSTERIGHCFCLFL